MNKSLLAIIAAAALALPEQAAAQSSADEDEIVVTARRSSVPGDYQPETVLGPGEVRALGADTVADVLAALAPQTGSASRRGGGRPIILLNGRRIGGFQEIRDLPSEAIARVEVYDEQLALQYGYAPDQRVVNFILRNRYRVNTAEAALGAAAEGARDQGSAAASHVNINRGDRLAARASFDTQSAVTERERGVFASTSPDARTLAPDAQSRQGSINATHAFSERLSANGTLQIEDSEEKSLLGLDSNSAVRQRTRDTQGVFASAGLDGVSAGWQWTATAAANFDERNAHLSDPLSPGRTHAEDTSFDLSADANGSVFTLLAGRARASGRVSLSEQRIASRSDAAPETVRLDRTTASARVGLTAPMTDATSPLGPLTLNATAAYSDLSDFGALTSFGGGFSWSPTDTLRVSLQAERSEAAPSLQQLGDALDTTPGVRFYDYSAGADALVVRTSGGNPSLGVERREDLTANLAWSPQTPDGLSLNFGYASNVSRDAIAALPVSLPETEAAFPDRFTRDATGALVAVDVRPINVARRETQSARLGLAYRGRFGTPIEITPGSGRRFGGMPPWGTAAPPWAERRDPQSQQPPPVDGAQAQPQAERQPDGFRRGPRSFQPGRWNLAVTYRQTLSDDLVLAPNAAPIDLLDRGGLGGGDGANSGVEFEGGVGYRGLGLRLSGNWSAAYDAPTASGTLSFSDALNLNLRAFVNFDQRQQLLAAAPLLRGTRLALSIENLTDDAVRVHDQTGATPASFQEGYVNPLGRVFSLSLRKQF